MTLVPKIINNHDGIYVRLAKIDTLLLFFLHKNTVHAISQTVQQKRPAQNSTLADNASGNFGYYEERIALMYIPFLFNSDKCNFIGGNRTPLERLDYNASFITKDISRGNLYQICCCDF